MYNRPTHGLSYPTEEEQSYLRKLHRTPTSARELVLLAQLVGWTPYVPVVLDMATRPDGDASTSYRWSYDSSWDLKRIWGGFLALKVLSGGYDMSCNAIHIGSTHVATSCFLVYVMNTLPSKHLCWSSQRAARARLL